MLGLNLCALGDERLQKGGIGDGTDRAQNAS